MRENSKLACDYTNTRSGIQCREHRRSMTRYCERHWENLSVTGHPEGQPVPRATLRHLQPYAMQYIATNRNHPEIVRALALIAERIVLPGRLVDPPFGRKPRKLRLIIANEVYRELRRLQTPSPRLIGAGPGRDAMLTLNEDGERTRPKPVSAEEVLAICIAVWTAYRLDSRLLKNNGICLDFALANAVFGLRKLRAVVTLGPEGRKASIRPPGMRARRAIGEILRAGVVTYVCNAIAEKIVPETPEQAIARRVDHLPLPDAEPISQPQPQPPRPVAPAAPVPAPPPASPTKPKQYRVMLTPSGYRNVPVEDD
jgi:hypothetical protein